MSYKILFKIQLITLFFFLANCSHEPQPKLKIALIVDNEEKFAILAEGDEVVMLQEKYADLIEIMDDLCYQEVPSPSKDAATFNAEQLAEEITAAYDKPEISTEVLEYLMTTFGAQEKIDYRIASDDLITKSDTIVNVNLSTKKYDCSSRTMTRHFD